MFHKIPKIHNLLIALLLTISNLTLFVDITVAADTKCDDIIFVFARGSGEQLGDTSVMAWQTELRNQLHGTGLRFSFYELGSTSYDGYQYPAVAVSGTLGSYLTMLGAYVSSGSTFAFGDSVKQGKGELKAYIAQISSACPNTKFVLGGYSQGAMVISGTLDELDANKILYVATFGDPKLYLPEGNDRFLGVIPKIPDACFGKNLSAYRISVSDCFAYEGVLGGYRPYQPSAYIGKIGVWCNDSDIMCSSGLSTGDHVLYITKQFYADAAGKIAALIRQEFASKISIGDNLGRGIHDIAFVIDSTISMRSILEEHRSEIKALAAEAVASGGRIALFEFRDVNIYPTKKLCDFGCTLDEFNAQIDAIVANWGGDAYESPLPALMFTMNSLDWRQEVDNSIILVTDGKYRDPDYDDTTLEMVIERSRNLTSSSSRSANNLSPIAIHVITKTDEIPTYTPLTEQTDGNLLTYDSSSDHAMQLIFGYPTASLQLDEYSGLVNNEFTFDASDSFAQNNSNLRFDWDLDGDDIFELEDAGSVVKQTYSTEFDGYVKLRVTDSADRSHVTSARVTAAITVPEVPTPARILDLQVSPLDNDSLAISFKTNGDNVVLSVNDEVLGFITLKSGSAQLTLGQLSDTATITLAPYLNRTRGHISAFTFTADGDIIMSPSPDSPNLPDLPETPEVPEIPNLPETPESPSLPEVPDLPVLPETPDSPKLPDLPESSETPGLPIAPETSNRPGGIGSGLGGISAILPSRPNQSLPTTPNTGSCQ